MQIQILKSKLHMARVTEIRPEYEGSLSVDSHLLQVAGILPYERVLCSNLSNGERFETYAIPSTPGSGEVILNGPAALLGKPGDRLVVMCFTIISQEEAKNWTPTCVVLDENNRPVHITGPKHSTK